MNNITKTQDNKFSEDTKEIKPSINQSYMHDWLPVPSVTLMMFLSLIVKAIES